MQVTPTPTTEAVRRGGILHFNLPGDPTNFDLHQAATSTDLWCIGPCFDTLLQFDPNDQTKILPDLAMRWDVSSDGMAYTFTLRQGVTFHDGSPFTSKDVQVTFQRIISPPEGVNSPRGVFFNTVS
ncbi:MAG: ABC transporter substrate-binding protein, partial [Dehalococcoidia bacterium]|nr:ABC transporter substrate-binding protein [Dehalococcoidia bacterium]